MDRKIALVTGASRGIGAAIARRLAADGAEVIVHYRERTDAAQQVVDSIVKAGGVAHAVRANLVNVDEIRAMFEWVERVDILVHSAALGSFKPLAQLRPNQWDLSMNVNARSFLVLVQESAHRMSSGGSIVALSSLGATRVVPSYGAIGASKAALEATVRSLAVELGSRGINVNAVAPGVVDSETIRAHPSADEILAEARRRTPDGRLIEPDDVANVVAWLTSNDARWINGQTIVVDGGASLWG